MYDIRLLDFFSEAKFLNTWCELYLELLLEDVLSIELNQPCSRHSKAEGLLSLFF